MAEQRTNAAVVEAEVEERAGGGEPVPERGRLEEPSVDLADGALDLLLARERRLGDRAPHVVFVPVEGGESVRGLELLEQRRARIRYRQRALEGLGPALREQPPRERDGPLRALVRASCRSIRARL